MTSANISAASDPKRWKPVHRGSVYCSPACGRGCTSKEYRGAKRLGSELAASLGDGWAVHVWENMGWFYSAVSPCGRIKVHPAGYGFMAFLSESGCLGGRWTSTKPAAQEAVAGVIDAMNEDLAPFLDLLSPVADLQKRLRSAGCTCLALYDHVGFSGSIQRRPLRVLNHDHRCPEGIAELLDRQNT